MILHIQTSMQGLSYQPYKLISTLMS